MIGRGVNGVDIYQWNGNFWSGLVGTSASRFSDVEGWADPKYYETIKTVLDGSTLWLYARGATGVDFYRWTGSNWEKPFPTCGVFADGQIPNSPVYWKSIQAFFVEKTPHLIWRGPKGIEIFRQKEGGWSLIYGPIGRFDKNSSLNSGLGLPYGLSTMDDFIYLWGVAFG